MTKGRHREMGKHERESVSSRSYGELSEKEVNKSSTHIYFRIPQTPPFLLTHASTTSTRPRQSTVQPDTELRKHVCERASPARCSGSTGGHVSTKRYQSSARNLLIASSPLQNQRSSPLLQLPGELRNTIYAHVLGNHSIDVQEEYWPQRFRISISPFQVQPHHITALLRTCRQIHAETHLLPFTLNIFSCENPSILQFFRHALTCKQRHAIAELQLEIHDSCEKVHLAAWSHVLSEEWQPSTTENCFAPLLRDFGGVRRFVVKDGSRRRYLLGPVRCEVFKMGGRDVEFVVE